MQTKSKTNSKDKTYLFRTNPEYTEYHQRDPFFRIGRAPERYQVCGDWTSDCDTIEKTNSYQQARELFKQLTSA